MSIGMANTIFLLDLYFYAIDLPKAALTLAKHMFMIKNKSLTHPPP
jgi:hypothetical protein